MIDFLKSRTLDNAYKLQKFQRYLIISVKNLYLLSNFYSTKFIKKFRNKIKVNIYIIISWIH